MPFVLPGDVAYGENDPLLMTASFLGGWKMDKNTLQEALALGFLWYGKPLNWSGLL